jgi:hypothetical protein
MSVGENKSRMEKLSDEHSAFLCCYRRVTGMIRSTVTDEQGIYQERERSKKHVKI